MQLPYVCTDQYISLTYICLGLKTTYKTIIRKAYTDRHLRIIDTCTTFVPISIGADRLTHPCKTFLLRFVHKEYNYQYTMNTVILYIPAIYSYVKIHTHMHTHTCVCMC